MVNTNREIRYIDGIALVDSGVVEFLDLALVHYIYIYIIYIIYIYICIYNIYIYLHI